MSDDRTKLLAACVDYRAMLDKLEAENAALKTALDHQMNYQRELRADKARLDWLDAQRPSGTLPHEGSWTVIGKGNLRTAIDAAMGEAQP